jgi:excisionase family DNA binding protein
MSAQPNVAAPDRKFISIKEAADELQISIKTIRRRISDRQLKAIKTGNVIRIDRRDWLKFLQKSATGGT